MQYNIGTIRGHINSSFWVNDTHDKNSKPFEELGISDKIGYCEKIIGYKPDNGDFPECKNQEDVIKICEALDTEIMAKKGYTLGTPILLDGKESMIKKNHYGYYLNEFRFPKGLYDKRLILQQEILGYILNGGYFPYCNNIGDVITLAKHINEIISSEKFHVGDYVTILYSNLNFRSSMNNFVGKVIKITSITQLDDTIYICFENDGGFTWSLQDKHFRKATKEEIDTIDTVPDTFTFSKIGDEPALEGVFRSITSSNWYWLSTTRDSDCFIGLPNKYDLQLKVLGYVSSGDFPTCYTKEDLHKFCLSIEKERIKAFSSTKEEIPDFFTFTVNSKSYSGDLAGSHSLWNWEATRGSNNVCFLPGWDKLKMQKEVLGYQKEGIFPYCKSKKDLYTFCQAIEIRLKGVSEFDKTDFIHKFPEVLLIDYSSFLDNPRKEEKEKEKMALSMPILIEVCKI